MDHFTSVQRAPFSKNTDPKNKAETDAPSRRRHVKKKDSD